MTVSLSRRALATVLTAALTFTPTPSRASMFAGALEPTQLANFVQLLEHTIHFIQIVRQGKQQVQRWKQNLEKLDAGHFLVAAGLVRDIGAALTEFRTVTFGARSNLETFQKQHPGYQAPPGAKQTYEQLDKDTNEAVARALKAVDVQLNDPKGGLKAQDQLIEELAGKIQGADGTVKALQIADELLVVLTKQMEKLLVLVAAQAAQQGAFIANETQRRSYGMYERDQYVQRRGRPHAAPPVDWSRDAFIGF